MKNILSFIFLVCASFLLAQSASQIESQRVAEANYKMQVSHGSFEKAASEMRISQQRIQQKNQIS